MRDWLDRAEARKEQERVKELERQQEIEREAHPTEGMMSNGKGRATNDLF